MYKKILLISVSALLLYGEDSFYYSNNKKVSLTPLNEQEYLQKASSRVQENITYYKTAQNNLLGVNDTIIVKFSDLTEYEMIVSKYQLQIVKKLYANVYLFKVFDKENILKTCNDLYQLQSVQHAHPNFTYEVKKR